MISVDFTLPPPHELKRHSNSTYEIASASEIAAKTVTVGEHVCFATIENAFVGPLGGIFTCSHQYPLLLHKSGLFFTKVKKVPKPESIVIHEHMISLAFRANDFFSHVFSVVSKVHLSSTHKAHCPV